MLSPPAPFVYRRPTRAHIYNDRKARAKTSLRSADLASNSSVPPVNKTRRSAARSNWLYLATSTNPLRIRGHCIGHRLSTSDTILFIMSTRTGRSLRPTAGRPQDTIDRAGRGNPHDHEGDMWGNPTAAYRLVALLRVSQGYKPPGSILQPVYCARGMVTSSRTVGAATELRLCAAPRVRAPDRPSSCGGGEQTQAPNRDEK